MAVERTVSDKYIVIGFRDGQEECTMPLSFPVTMPGDPAGWPAWQALENAVVYSNTCRSEAVRRARDAGEYPGGDARLTYAVRRVIVRQVMSLDTAPMEVVPEPVPRMGAFT